ncbi:hypothetical protein [Streptomyces tendae]|uniref:hypothetical protein n=1 Tax=Streptomyces tendae TaxID=1932 RepID=UPI00342D4F8F
MANNQAPLAEGNRDIIQQSEAYTMAGITRATLRGCIDRGELRIADHHGSRGSARLYRSDVVRLMTERKWPGADGSGVVPAQAEGNACRDCAVLRAEVRTLKQARVKDADTMGRMRVAIDNLTRPED